MLHSGVLSNEANEQRPDGVAACKDLRISWDGNVGCRNHGKMPCNAAPWVSSQNPAMTSMYERV